jgi:hypothetical protein
VLKLKTGDHLLMDAKSGYLLEKLPKNEVEDLSLEEVPDIGYDAIGGMTEENAGILTRRNRVLGLGEQRFRNRSRSLIADCRVSNTHRPS